MQPGWDFTQIATCRSSLLARTVWFSILLHLGSNYCHWVAIRFIGLDARTKSDIQNVLKHSKVELKTLWRRIYNKFINQVFTVGLRLVQKAIRIIFTLLINITDKLIIGFTPRVVGFSHPVRVCKHFSHHASQYCLSVSVTNMLSYTQYHCHLVPKAFLASYTGAGNSAPALIPSSLMNDVSCRLIVGLVFPWDDIWKN